MACYKPGSPKSPGRSGVRSVTASERELSENAERNGVQRVTLVDDDAAVRESLRQWFQRDERFAVLSEHARAKDALKQLTDMPSDQQPDLVLLDISMPVMDGIGCCGALRERFPDLTIAMFTASSVRNCFELARLAGADAYIVKGAGRNTLIQTLLQLNRCAGQCLCVAEEDALKPTQHACHELTVREIAVLDYISRGGIYKQAAEHFFCSESNIKKTMARAISHLNARSKDHAIRLWLEGARGVLKDTFPPRDDSGRNYTNQ
jgi:DNA-binding NarL/FixJ family response regulator